MFAIWKMDQIDSHIFSPRKQLTYWNTRQGNFSCSFNDLISGMMFLHVYAPSSRFSIFPSLKRLSELSSGFSDCSTLSTSWNSHQYLQILQPSIICSWYIEYIPKQHWMISPFTFVMLLLFTHSTSVFFSSFSYSWTSFLVIATRSKYLSGCKFCKQTYRHLYISNQEQFVQHLLPTELRLHNAKDEDCYSKVSRQIKRKESPPGGNRKRRTARGITCQGVTYPGRGGNPSLAGRGGYFLLTWLGGGGVPHSWPCQVLPPDLSGGTPSLARGYHIPGGGVPLPDLAPAWDWGTPWLALGYPPEGTWDQSLEYPLDMGPV